MQNMYEIKSGDLPRIQGCQKMAFRAFPGCRANLFGGEADRINDWNRVCLVLWMEGNSIGARRCQSYDPK